MRLEKNKDFRKLIKNRKYKTQRKRVTKAKIATSFLLGAACLGIFNHYLKTTCPNLISNLDSAFGKNGYLTLPLLGTLTAGAVYACAQGFVNNISKIKKINREPDTTQEDIKEKIETYYAQRENEELNFYNYQPETMPLAKEYNAALELSFYERLIKKQQLKKLLLQEKLHTLIRYKVATEEDINKINSQLEYIEENINKNEYLLKINN